jgi:hypothetical protein
MAEQKAKTQLELFGFKDPDIHKSGHDEMILWIYRNIQDILMHVLKIDTRPNATTKMEALVKDRNRQLGHVDLYVSYDHKVGGGDWKESHCCIEAKTKIGTLGALLRQIRFYQDGTIDGSRICKMPFIVVSEDDRFADVLNEQGVKFLKYDPKMSFAFLGGV